MLKILTTNINDYFYELMSDQISKDIHPMMLLSLLADKLKFYKNLSVQELAGKKIDMILLIGFYFTHVTYSRKSSTCKCSDFI